MKKVTAKSNAVAAPMDQDVIVEFEITIAARREARRLTDGAEGVAQRHLRVAHVRRICGNTLEAVSRSKWIPRIGVALSAGDFEASRDVAR